MTTICITVRCNVGAPGGILLHQRLASALGYTLLENRSRNILSSLKPLVYTTPAAFNVFKIKIIKQVF